MKYLKAGAGFEEDRNYILDNVTYMVVNKKFRNKIIIEDIPYIEYHHFIVLFWLPDKIDQYKVSHIITNEILEAKGIILETLDKAAYRNTKDNIQIKTLEEVFSDAGVSVDESENVIPIYVVTNAEKLNGASAIVIDGVFDDIADTLKSDLLILPSSIHEILAIPIGLVSEEEVNETIQKVNKTLSEWEILGDKAYKYEKESKNLSING